MPENRNRPETPAEFIAALRTPALVQAARTGIPAGFIVAQAALETAYGKRIPVDLASGRCSYNLFGIKWSGAGDYVTAWTQEFVNGKWVRVQARFRAYDGFAGSMEDHSRLLLSNRYRGCLDSAADPEAYARCIAKAGYATDPKYADKVILIMRRWNLVNLRPGVFPDVAEDDFAAEAIVWCLEQGVMRGREDGLFHPDDPATRRELAIVLKRLHDLLKK